MALNFQNELAAVYESVIAEVIGSCKDIFADERVDETVLDEIKSSWRQKMIDSGALPSPQTQPPQSGAVFMSAVAQKGHPTLVGGQSLAVRTAVQHSNELSNLHSMVLGQPRVAPGHSLTPAAFLATSTIRSQLKHDISGMPSTQPILHQQPPPQGRNVISAVIVPVTKSAGNSDLKNAPGLSRQVQIDGRYDGQPSSSGNSEPPAKRLARDGFNGPVSDESDHSDSEINGLDDFTGTTEDVAVPSAVLGDEEEPLNSGDDVSEAEEDVFDCPNLLVCQYEKVNRAKAKWRFSFKDAILQQNGAGPREYLFSRITGEADFS